MKKKNRIINKIAAFSLAAMVIVSNLAMTTIVFADEDYEDYYEDYANSDYSEPSGGTDDGYDLPDDNQDTTDQGNQTIDEGSQTLPDQTDPDVTEPEPPKQDEKPNLTFNGKATATIAFGTKSKSSEASPQELIVKNAGASDVSVTSSWADANRAFTSQFVGNLGSSGEGVIPAGGTVRYIISAAENLPPDDYDADFIISADNGSNIVTYSLPVTLVVKKSETPVVKNVVVNPGKVEMTPGGTYSFNAEVNGNNLSDTSVNWYVDGNKSSGTSIAGNGTLSVAKDETASNLVVTAQSNADQSQKGTAMVNLNQVGYNVIISADPSKGGKIAGGGVYQNGSTATLTAVASKGYEFSGWYDMAGTKISSKGQFKTDKITGDIKYVAKFKKTGATSYKVKVEINNSDGGSVEGAGNVAAGGSVTLKANTKDGYVFNGWSEGDNTFSKDTTVTISNINSNRTIKASFVKYDYSVCVQAYPPEGGKVTGGGKVKRGDKMAMSASAAPGYSFRGWMLNNNLISNSMNYEVSNIDRDLTFYAVFDKQNTITHNITAGVANAGGVISPSGVSHVADGGSITYVMAPNSGYKVLAVAIDNKQIGAVNSYTFTNVTGDHTIAVAFAAKENSVNNVKTDPIISTAEAAAIAVAKLEKADTSAGAGSNTRNSEIMNGKANPAAPETVTVEEITVQPEQNLIGMDDTDNIVEEMEGYDYNAATGIYQILDITPEEAEAKIDSGDDADLLQAAYENGYLDISVNNEYSVSGMMQELSEGGLVDGNATIPNLMDFVSGLLTKEEKLQLLEGKNVSLNFSVMGEDPSYVGDSIKSLMKGVDGVTIGSYFDMVLIKSVSEVSEVVDSMPVSLTVVLKVPEELKKDNRTFCVVREHDGQVTVLEDQDSNPDTVTIQTDRFSTYAFGYYGGGSAGGSAAKIIIWAVAIIVVLAGVAATIIIIRRRRA